MKILVLITVLVASATAQLFPVGPFRNQFPSEDQYAASLGGAPVGLYDKKHGFGWGPYGGYGSDVTGVSLGGARVGLYGKENQRGAPPPFPIRLPILPFNPALPYRPIRPRPYVRPPYRPRV